MSIPSPEKLRQYVQRLETLENQKSAIAEDTAEVFAELKGEGFEPKIVRQILKMRKMEPEELQEQEELLRIYLEALSA
jgi:uncharacterized protein (UPF0335 family)